MLRNRLFKVFIFISLVTVIALTAREAYATSIIISEKEGTVKCADLPSRYSIHNEYDEESGAWTLYSEDGPTGVDGGFMHLMSAYRSCTK